MILDADDIKNSKITLSLILLNIICFIVFGSPAGERYLLLLVQINYKIIENIEIWRLFTSMFIHSDIMHLFSNMLGLLIFGVLVENNFSKLEYLILYFFSGLIGNLFSLFLLPVFSISLGSSGAIFGLIGTSFLIIALENPSLLMLALLYVMFFLASSFSPGINLWAHIFGLVGGIIFGYLFRRYNHPKIDYYS